MLRQAKAAQRFEIVHERVIEMDLLPLADINEIPIDDIGQLFMQDRPHRFAAKIGPRVGRRLQKEVALGQAR